MPTAKKPSAFEGALKAAALLGPAEVARIRAHRETYDTPLNGPEWAQYALMAPLAARGGPAAPITHAAEPWPVRVAVFAGAYLAVAAVWITSAIVQASRDAALLPGGVVEFPRAPWVRSAVRVLGAQPGEPWVIASVVLAVLLAIVSFRRSGPPLLKAWPKK
jgi:hypothetical protein